MSSIVAHRLVELAERGEARRRRTLEIRKQSSLLFSRAHQLGRGHVRGVARPYWQESETIIAVDKGEECESLDEVAVPARDDVLDQVRALLSEVDAREQECWDEEDTRIVVCFEEAWAAAQRKGYTLEELQAVLRVLCPPR